MDENLRKQQELYDKGWRSELEIGKEERGNLQTNLEFLEQAEQLRTGDRILEIGCGIGSVVFNLSKQGYDVIGTDISGEAINYGLKKYGDIKLQVQAAETLPYEDDSFDVVLSFDLFEHIAATDAHLSEVRRVLRSGGHYLFQTPNKYSNAVFETLWSRSFKWRRYHPSLHSPGQLKRRLAKHGFETRFVKMNPINEFTLKKLKKIGPLGHVIKNVDFRKMPLMLQTNLYVIAHKTRD
ncbi:MAG: class I SAM-dependent methyltransferase [Phycisphaerales bacterium]|nr:MAG: class I SAM-dependent methyltransferase [Phycisphaerales bacterium]